MIYECEHVNKYALGDMDELIYFSEARIQLQYEMLLNEIHVADVNCHENLTDLVMVTGPSSSGKTTFSKLLAEKLAGDGYNCTVLSLDNYYHDRSYMYEMALKAGRVPEHDRDFDFECIDAFNVEKFRRDMDLYLSGQEVILPEYDFTDGAAHPGNRKLTPTEKDIIIVEGIQALNPVLTEGINFHRVFRVYICPFDYYVGFHHGETISINPKQIRFMRRSLRDSVHRNSPLDVTMTMWQGVRMGEEKYIKPMKKYADFFFNSSFEYEISYLKYHIMNLYEELGDEDKIRFARVIELANLKPFVGVPKLNVPKKSLFNEFYLG